MFLATPIMYTLKILFCDVYSLRGRIDVVVLLWYVSIMVTYGSYINEVERRNKFIRTRELLTTVDKQHRTITVLQDDIQNDRFKYSSAINNRIDEIEILKKSISNLEREIDELENECLDHVYLNVIPTTTRLSNRNDVQNKIRNHSGN